MPYSKTNWVDHIVDPGTGAIVQQGTKVTANRMNKLEQAAADAFALVEGLAQTAVGSAVLSGLTFTNTGLTANFTAGTAYVNGVRFDVAAGSLALNPTQGQYIYLDSDGIVKKTTSQATAQAKCPLWYFATDASNVITSTNQSKAAIVITQDQLDAAIQTLKQKASVKVATTANITLSGTQTIDGVAVAIGDRVLVKNQTTASQNGIYVVATGAWTRAADADTSAKVTTGLTVYVEQGTANAQSRWTLATTGTITLGTTALSFILTGGVIGGGANQIPTRSATGVLTADILTNFKKTKSSKDASGIYTVVEYRRIADNTLYMRSTLSNPDAKGNYQTDTRVFYKLDGATVDTTVTVTLTYDADGDLLSEVPSA
ncbi:hypothetical protein ACTID9_01105 [Brevibacillus fluminis]|uniref:hypothetical protein n=1 Tax=Brevibacillus fluminis TaxID=511487 RepID=UPI003F8A7BC0